MIATLYLEGHIPCKKNRWHRGLKGQMYFDEPAGKRGTIKAQIDWLVLQASDQWKKRAPVEHPEMTFSFTVQDGRSDRDGKLTTLLDVLVKAGVLANDSTARCNGLLIIVPARIAKDEEESTRVRLEFGLLGRAGL